MSPSLSASLTNATVAALARHTNEPTNMRIYIETLGCRLNEAEVENWSREFVARGHQLSRQPEDSDLLLVNTCAVTQEAVRKSRKLLHRSQRQNPQAKLVVSGCYASLEPAAVKQTAGVDLLISNQDKERLVELVCSELNLAVVPAAADDPATFSLLEHNRQRAFIKIQDGCRHRCSFCVVSIARGEEKSRQQNEIVSEINLLHAQGIQEIVLTGVHIGGYGNDIGGTLTELIQQILRQTEIRRLRVGSIEPWDLSEEFWKLFADPRLLPHLHLPLQSGSDSVLRRMARRYRSQEYAMLIEQARQRIADFNVTTDILVGFPGETEAEWQQTIEFVEQIDFSHLHIFSYSPRQGTKAATLPDQVSQQTKRQRSEQLHKLGQNMRQRVFQRWLGSTCEVLVEGNGSSGWRGYTPNYLPVEINARASGSLENKIVKVILNSISSDSERLLGKLK